MMAKVPNAGLTLVQHCFSTIHYPNPLPRVASHRLGTTTLIQLWYNVGTTIPDVETRNFKTKKFFGDTEILVTRNVLML